MYYKDITTVAEDKEFPPMVVFESQEITIPAEDVLEQFDECSLVIALTDDDGTLGHILSWFGLPLEMFDANEIRLTGEIPPATESKLLKIFKMEPSLYFDAKMHFKEKMEAGVWNSMLDQLKEYNVRDCLVLQQTWEKFSALIYEKFAVDVQQTLSLSQLAQQVLLKHYPRQVAPIMSLSKEYTWFNKEIRLNLFGGLAAVFHRHVQTKVDANLPPTAYTTPNGQHIKVIRQEDFNSLYPAVMKESLPVGSGIFYERRDEVFHPKMMKTNTGANGSMISFHWLNHMQGKYVANGIVHRIQCAITGPEMKIGEYFLDGYVEFDRKRIGLDFR